MKRMIACEKCSHRPIPSFEGEWFKRVHGVAKNDMLCDWCSTGSGDNLEATPIKKGDKCSAESMGLDGHGIPYYEWESEFITKEAKDV